MAKRKIVSIFITLGAKCAVIHKGSEKGEGETERGRHGRTFTSIRCSTNMQTAFPLTPYRAKLCFLSHARACLCMSVLVWSTCWKFKAPAQRQATLITPQSAPKTAQGAKGQQTKWCPNPKWGLPGCLGGFSGRAWPTAIAQEQHDTAKPDTRRGEAGRGLCAACRLANCHGHDHYWLAKPPHGPDANNGPVPAQLRLVMLQPLPLLLLPRAKCRHIKTPHKADKRAGLCSQNRVENAK